VTVRPTPITVVIASPLPDEHVARIRDALPDKVRVLHDPSLIPAPRYVADHVGTRPTLDPAASARWLGMLAEADVLFDFDWYAPADMARNAPRLRWVQATSSGIGEYVRRKGLDRTGIVFTNVAGVHGTPLAEFVVMGLLYLVKDVPRMRAAQDRHQWQRYSARQLAGQRVLLVGLGAVGGQIARTLDELGIEVWGLRRTGRSAPPGVRRLIPRMQLVSALAAVDAIVLAAPYTPETHHLIGAAEIGAMPAHAVVVNVGRGQLVDEPALVAALEAGRLGGAVLDVFETEPLPDDSPLWELSNVLVSPHSASTVATENDAIVDLFLDNLERFLAGRPLRNVYDRDRGY
jgi:glyoxylate/hydroxypyruvate reductase A